MQIYTAESLTDDLLTQNIVTPGGRIIASQRYDNDSPVGWYFYNYDIRQSTTTILNEDYGVEKSYKYDEFGNTVESGSLLNEIAYTSAVSDSNTGLYYMNSRYYNPNTGRFLTQDSYKGNPYDPWTQHLYSYVGNNPVNMIDPTGHSYTYIQDGRLYTGDADEYGDASMEDDWAVPNRPDSGGPVVKFIKYSISEGKKSEEEHDEGIPTDNSNRRVESGKDTDDTMYNYWFNMVGEDWCGYYTMYCAEQCGIYGIARASTYRLNAYTSEKLRRESSDGYRPYAGDIFYYFTDKDNNGVKDKGTRSHIGIVLGSDEQYMYTVEGNITPQGEITGMVQFVMRPYVNIDNLHFVSNNIGVYNPVEYSNLPFIIDPKSTN